MNKITLVSSADGINIESTKRSILGFKKFNGNVIVVNNNHSDEINKICKDINVTVFSPQKTYSYPIFNKDQTEEHVDFVYSTMLEPASIAGTEYVMFGEPDSLFVRPIDQNILDGTDIIVSSDRSKLKVMWAFSSFYDGFGQSDAERDCNIIRLFGELRPICKNVNLDFDTAARGDLRFVFSPNCIVKTEKIKMLFLHEKENITYLIREFTRLIEKYRPKEGIPDAFEKYNKNFGPDQIFSIIFGLYLFTWKVNDNGLNCHWNMFNTENDLHDCIEKAPNLEYIHSCKLYYNAPSKKIIDCGFKNYTEEELRSIGLIFGNNVSISRDVVLHNPHNISVGNNVRIDAQCILIAGKEHKIKIGSYVHISAGCYYYGNSGNITLEDYTCTSARCTLYTANDDYVDGYMTNSTIPEKYKKITTGDIFLEKHSLVGCYTVILPGVILKHATSVGAHSFVTKSTERFDVIAGVPSKFIKKRKNIYLDNDVQE